MVKGNPKSSASSSTRKKHAKKALGPPDQPDTPNRDKKPKAKEKGKGASKREARVKMYIPPTKPAPVQPDPLDAMGLAHRLPPELLVVLRSLGKKAEVTKVRALEDLQAHWVERCDDDAVLSAVTDMLPVWLEAILGTWCLAAHDIDKAVAATASASWTPFIARASPLPPPAALARTFEFCQSMLLDPLGTYTYLNPPQPAAPPPPSAPHARAKMAGRNAHGSGRQTPVRQREDPDAARREDEHEETETDRKARLRVAAFGAIGWLLSHQPPTSEHAPVPTEDPTHIDAAAVHALLANPALWTALAHDNSVSVCPAIVAFGLAQPPVRRAAWAFVDALLRVRARAQTQGKGKGKRDYIGVQAQLRSGLNEEPHEEPGPEPHEESQPQIQPERQPQLQPDTDATDAKEGRGGGVLGVLSAALLRAPWADPDPGVRAAMWGPLLTFLRAFPEAWTLEARFAVPGEGEEGSDDEEEQDYDDDKEGQDDAPPTPYKPDKPDKTNESNERNACTEDTVNIKINAIAAESNDVDGPSAFQDGV
ncbi:listerin E3 ubiquitin protein ligase 1 [Pleurotus pulmonarius]|nr:listerin E3 ubiquitin protein ligase 1 [Pleurotus pulmonarius]